MKWLLALLPSLLLLQSTATYPPAGVKGVLGSSGAAEITAVELTCNGGPAVPSAINDAGEIAGWCFDGIDAEAAIFRGGAWVRLGEPTPAGGWTATSAHNMSPSGAVSGFAFGPSPNTWGAFHAPAGATALTLDAVFGGGGNIPPDGFAYGINNSLNRVGCINRYDDVFPDPHRAYFFVHSGSVFDELTDEFLALIPAWNDSQDYSCLRDLNESNVAVGEIQPSALPARGFVYDRGTDAITVLGPLTFTYPALTNAKEINESGTVVGEGRLVGWSADHAMQWKAGVFSSAGVKESIFAPTSSKPEGLNDLGDSCGLMVIGGADNAYFADSNKVVVNLNLLKGLGQVTLRECRGINNRREMVVSGIHSGSPGTTRYYKVVFGS